jgi:hypothetical protein
MRSPVLSIVGSSGARIMRETKLRKTSDQKNCRPHLAQNFGGLACQQRF